MLHVGPEGGGGGGTRLSFGRGGGAAGGRNLTLSQTARRTKNTPCHNIPYENFHMHTLYWCGRTRYSAMYHHTYMKFYCARRRDAGAEIASLSRTRNFFPTAVVDTQYELICIQPIRATWYEYEWLASSE